MSDQSGRVALRSLLYSSTATRDLAQGELAELLAVSRDNNRAASITGLLLYRRGRFLQLLEGPEEVVDQRMVLIRDDDRHRDVTTLLSGPIADRQFPDWTMGFARPSGFESDPLDGYRASLDDLFAPRGMTSDYGTFLPALRALMRWYRERPGEIE